MEGGLFHLRNPAGKWLKAVFHQLIAQTCTCTLFNPYPANTESN